MVGWERVGIIFFILFILLLIVVMAISEMIKESKMDSFCQEHGLKSSYPEMRCYSVTKDTINKYPIEFDGGIYNGKIYFVREGE